MRRSLSKDYYSAANNDFLENKIFLWLVGLYSVNISIVLKNLFELNFVIFGSFLNS